MFDRFRHLLPEPHRLREHRLLRHFGPALHHPRVWHFNRRGVANGLAIGLFFGLLIPLAQIPVSAAFALLLRANIPVAVVSTLITNPFTFAPIYFLAYQLGTLVVGDAAVPLTEQALQGYAADQGAWLDVWVERITAMGQPLLVGLLMLAVSLGAAGYLLVHALWRARTLRRWRQRHGRA